MRALQELVTAASSPEVIKYYFYFYQLFCYNLIVFQGKGGTGSGHRTLLYGNAILLRHQNSDMVRLKYNKFNINLLK